MFFFLQHYARVSYTGITSAFQADEGGSIPPTRLNYSKKSYWVNTLIKLDNWNRRVGSETIPSLSREKLNDRWIASGKPMPTQEPIPPTRLKL